MSPRNTQFTPRRPRNPSGCDSGASEEISGIRGEFDNTPLSCCHATMNERLGDDAVRHLQALLKIDTTNPPGNETAAAEYLAELFTAAKLPPVLVGARPERKNVIARLHGSGEKPPLLLAAHLDVVPVELDKWNPSAVRRRDPRRLSVGPRRDRHEAHGGDVRAGAAQAQRGGRAAQARRDLRRRGRRGGRLRRRLAFPGRPPPPTRCAPSLRSAKRVASPSTSAARSSTRSRSPRRARCG